MTTARGPASEARKAHSRAYQAARYEQAKAARDRADAQEDARRSGNVSVGYNMVDDADPKTEEPHGSQSAKEAVAARGTNAHPLVGSEGQQPTDRAGAELAICPGPKTSGGPCPSP